MECVWYWGWSEATGLLYCVYLSLYSVTRMLRCMTIQSFWIFLDREIKWDRMEIDMRENYVVGVVLSDLSADYYQDIKFKHYLYLKLIACYIL